MSEDKQNLVEISPRAAAEQAGTAALTLVDVRDTDERRELAPAVKSLHIPVDEIDQRIGELPADSAIAFVCGSGARSSKAAAAAQAAGLDVRNVSGGMKQWVADGVPTEKGSA